jgi:hypothetical protein
MAICQGDREWLERFSGPRREEKERKEERKEEINGINYSTRFYVALRSLHSARSIQ